MRKRTFFKKVKKNSNRVGGKVEGVEGKEVKQHVIKI
jgi:hypothetical protein